ncbi:MAG: hypothetical protein Q8P95_02240, partial [bacterium]|nr:hypothetical protein [bacterium]
MNSVSFRESESFLKSFTDGPKRDKGQVFLLIDLPDNPGAEDSISEKIWRALRNSYFNCQADDSYFCFEEALKRANEVVEQEGKKRESGSIGRLHAVAALKDGRTLHFSQVGLGVLYLQRGKHFSQISEDAESEGDGSFSTISSGELADSDRVVMSTRPLSFETAELAEVFSQKGARLASQLKSLGKASDLTGIVSHFSISSVEESSEASEVFESEQEPDTSSESSQVSSEQRKPKMIRLADHKVMQALSKHFNKEKFEGISKIFGNVFSGLRSRLGKVMKKPELVKQVNRRYILVGVITLVVVFGVV